MDPNVTVLDSTNGNTTSAQVQDPGDTERAMETESTDIALESDDSEPEQPSIDSAASAAFQSRLTVDKLSDQEVKLFPDVSTAVDSSKVTEFLYIRNKILQLWLQSPRVQLSLKGVYPELEKPYDEVSRLFVAKIYAYLKRYGYINFGMYKTVDPIIEKKKLKVVVVGAGMAGLAAARQLKSLGAEVIIIEARDRVGGRVATFRKGPYIADLGAMVVTGLGGNPITVISRQIKMELHKIKQDCPLFETGGQRVPKEKDVLVEKEFNKLLEATAYLSHELEVTEIDDKPLSLGKAFELIIQLQEKKVKEDQIKYLTAVQGCYCKLKSIAAKMITLEANMKKYSDDIKKAIQNAGGQESTDVTIEFEIRSKKRDLRTAVKEYALLDQDKNFLESRLSNLEENPPTDIYLSSKDRQLLDWHLANLEFANAADLDKLSLRHWNQDDAFEFSGCHLVVRNGYSVVPEAFAEGLNIQLETAVRAIRYSKQGCAVLTQSTKEESKKVAFDCDAVLCTLPLGVLKQEQATPVIVFSPELPKWKTVAIKRMGYGNLNKVIMCFEKPFWQLNSDNSTNISSNPQQEDESEIKAKKRNLFGHVATTTASRGELFLFWSLYRAPVLLALIAGKASDVAEKIGDDFILSRTLAVLKGIYGTDNVPEPKYYHVTRWGSDPWAKGSYSYVSTTSSGEDYDVMAEPVYPIDDNVENILPRLFFAGEHTNRNYPATVHGALLSGFREAGRIAETFLDDLNNAGQAEMDAVNLAQTV